MTSFIAKVRERRAEITAQIAALVAERDENDAALRVLARFGFDIAGDEPADQSTAARKDVPTAPDLDRPMQGAGTQAPPVETNSADPTHVAADPAATVAENVRVAADQSTGNVDGSAGRSHSDCELSTESPASVPVDTNSNLQHDAGDRADPDPHSLVGSSNSPEGASDVAADRARKPSVDPDVEPVRQAGGNASTSGKPAGGAGASPAAPTLRQLIRPVHIDHPDWTARQIAEHINRPHASVSAILGQVRKELRVESAAAAEPAEPDPEPEAPEPTPEPERPPAVTPEPANDIASADRPMRPSGRQYWLINRAGEYLNRFCLGSTRDRREAWSGSAMQLVACRRKFEIARDLSDKPVEKEQAAPINREVA